MSLVTQAPAIGTLRLPSFQECSPAATIYELRKLLSELRTLLSLVDMLGERARLSGLDRFEGASQCRGDDIWWGGMIRGIFGIIAAGAGLSKALGQDWMEALKVSNDVGSLVASTAFDSDGVRAEGRGQVALNATSSIGELRRALGDTLGRVDEAFRRTVQLYLQLQSMRRT